MRPLKIILSIAVSGVALSACSFGQSGGTLGTLQQVAKTCPSGQVAGYGADDVSDSGRGNPQLTAQRLHQIRALVTETAVCGGGHLEVVAFSSSEAAFQTLYDGNVQPVGATENARLLQVPLIVNEVMKTITSALPRATKDLPSQGSDIISQFYAAAQYAEQLGSSYHLNVEILTDGVSTAGEAITNTSGFTSAAAISLGKSVPVPSLKGALVTISGVGQVATGTPAPTWYVQALTNFYQIACRRTGAHCTVVTNPI